jgi:hypothetical protein
MRKAVTVRRMKNVIGVVMVGALCLMGCKKKEAAAPAAGSAVMGSDTMGSAAGSAAMGSAAMGSDTAAMGSGSAAVGSDAVAMGSATGSAAAGSDAAGSAAPAAHWDCKKTCKLAASCKSPAFHSVKECETDCTKLEKDTDGRYARGSIEGTPYYTCMATAKDCAASKKCDHP